MSKISNNYIFEFCVPQETDYISVDGNAIELNCLLRIDVRLFSKIVEYRFGLESSKQSLLPVFPVKGAIEFAPIECNLKCTLFLRGEKIPFIIKNVNYNSHGNSYVVVGDFSLNDLKIYQEFNENIKSAKPKVFNEENVGTFIDLED